MWCIDKGTLDLIFQDALSSDRAAGQRQNQSQGRKALYVYVLDGALTIDYAERLTAA